ncbi:AAA family ATPase [Sinomonas sp. P47F7]|uniref:AAA family ATPase n=1 Tax=Sinomonas sp. P47F7 TaxID=3410987 RepID=UPI003BF5DBE1
MRPAPEFVVTKQHRRFAEFCDAVRRDRYIGLCHGAPGVGKTLSARHYSSWDTIAPVVENFRFFETVAPESAIVSRTVFYTPKVHNTPRTVHQEVRSLHTRLSWAIEMTLHPDHEPERLAQSDGPYTELVIVDEADRLKTPSLEALRDHHDRTGAGLILIGMPGIERRLARYPQLYSRVGFLHHYQPLSTDEQAFVLSRQWPDLGLDDTDDFTTGEARAAIIRVTGGNFRLTARLMAQIHRIMEINKLSTVTSEVVDAARESLVIGIL